MEEVPKLVRDTLARQPVPATHPDADQLTAFAESTLTRRERESVLAHLANCHACREAVSLVMPPPESEPRAVIRDRNFWRLPVLRWIAVGASAVVVIAAVSLRRAERQPVMPATTDGYSAPAQNTRADKLATAPAPVAATPLGDKPAVVRQEVDRRELDSRAEVKPKAAPHLQKEEAGLRRDHLDHLAGGVAGKPLAKDEVTSASNEVAGKQPATTTFTLNSNAPTLPVASRNVAPAKASAELARSDAAPAAAPSAPPAPATESNVAVAQAAPAAAASGYTAEVAQAKKAKVQRSPVIAMSGGSKEPVAVNSQAFEKGLEESGRPAAWRVSKEGRLERSFDSGKSWQPMLADEGPKFRVVSVVGSEVWAGGQGDALFHSSDSGKSWARIRPAAGDVALAGDVVRIVFSSTNEGDVITSAGDTWTTHDGGKTWGKK